MTSFLLFILQCIYFMMPAYFSNMSAVFMRKTFSFMAFPLDFNKTLKGKPILGKNKTFRGLFFGVFFGIFIAFIQSSLYGYETFRNLSFFDYSNWLLFGFLMGFGAIFGDAVKSFFKRRLSIEPGSKFVPFDQIDFIVSGMIFVIPIFNLTLKIFFTSLVASVILLILVNHIAFYLHIRSEKW